MTVAGESHRISACDRHPSSDPVTGFCPSCLRDRLSYLDPPSDLRPSKSQSSAKDAALSDLRRTSCDVRPRTSLSLLFRSDDGDRPILIESDDLVLKELDNKTLVKNENENENEEEEEEIDAKPMKEHIEIELEHRSKRYSSSLLSGAASIFTQKLSKWRLKQQNRKKPKNSIPIGESNADRNDMFKPDRLIARRRSCDIEPRLSVDENPNPNRNSFDEPRASWDGYMIAKTIPRLAPMLSVIENRLIVEDETNSISESSSSARRNSFDCSSSGKSSGKNRMHVEIDDLKLAATKVVDMCVDTGHLEIDICNDGSLSGQKNSGSIKWKVLKMLGFKGKSNETREIGDVERDCSGKEIRVTKKVPSEKVLGRKSFSCNRSPYVGDIRGHAIPFDRTRSVRYSPSPNSFENGLLRFHLTPPLTRKKKPERKNSVLSSQSNARGVSRLS